MMTESNDRRPRTYSRDEIHSILHRATEIESVHAASFTEGELRQIAAEAGISERALSAALSETSATVPATVAPSRRPSKRIAWLGVAAAVTTAVLEPSALLLFLSFETCSLVLAMESRGKHALRTFILANSAVWAGVTAAQLAPSALAALSVPILALIGSTVVGVFALALRDILTPQQSTDTSDTGGAARSGTVEKLKGVWRRFVRLIGPLEFEGHLAVGRTPK
jgi:hypothetical protein